LKNEDQDEDDEAPPAEGGEAAAPVEG